MEPVWALYRVSSGWGLKWEDGHWWFFCAYVRTKVIPLTYVCGMILRADRLLLLLLLLLLLTMITNQRCCMCLRLRPTAWPSIRLYLWSRWINLAPLSASLRQGFLNYWWDLIALPADYLFYAFLGNTFYEFNFMFCEFNASRRRKLTVSIIE